MKHRVYMRRITIGVDKTSAITTVKMVTYPRDGGSTKLEVRPAGGAKAGVRWGSPAMMQGR